MKTIKKKKTKIQEKTDKKNGENGYVSSRNRKKNE